MKRAGARPGYYVWGLDPGQGERGSASLYRGLLPDPQLESRRGQSPRRELGKRIPLKLKAL